MSLLEIKDLHYGYPGLPEVLSGVSLMLSPGERLSIIGPNGAGKSTLLRLIVGLMQPNSGTVSFDGVPCTSEEDFHRLRRRIGLVFQDPDDQLFCPTVAEDIAFGPLNLGKSRVEAIEIVDKVLADLNLMHLRNRVTHKLSGGEKRLVTLATVLAMEPEVLLLDEPTNALDVENEARLVEILNGLSQAIILVSHAPEFRAKIAPQSYVLKGGHLQLVPAMGAAETDIPIA